MKIETEFNLGDYCYLLMLDAVREATIERIETSRVRGQKSIIHTIDMNPAGSQYTKRFLEKELFATKQDLLDSL